MPLESARLVSDADQTRRRGDVQSGFGGNDGRLLCGLRIVKIEADKTLLG